MKNKNILKNMRNVFFKKALSPYTVVFNVRHLRSMVFFIAFISFTAAFYPMAAVYAEEGQKNNNTEKQKQQQKQNTVTEEDLFRFELLYYDYLRSKNPAVLKKQAEFFYTKQQRQKLAAFIHLLEEKNDIGAQQHILQSIVSLGDYTLLYKLYFQEDPARPGRLKKMINNYPAYYYQSLLLRNENLQLLRAIVDKLWLAPSNTSIEFNYLRQLSLKNKEKKRQAELLRHLKTMKLNVSTAEHKALAGNPVYPLLENYFKKSLLEHIYFTLSQYQALAKSLIIKPSQPDTSLMQTKVFKSLAAANLQLRRNFLNILYRDGHYDSFLELSELLGNEVSVNKVALQRAALLSRKKSLQQKYASLSTELQAKLFLYENNYTAIVEKLNCSDIALNSGLEAQRKKKKAGAAISAAEAKKYALGKNTRRLCAIALAATKQFSKYKDLVSGLNKVDKQHFQWMGFFFSNNHSNSSQADLNKQLTALAKRSLETKQRLALELDFLNVVDTQKKGDSARFVELFKRILAKDKDLLNFAEANKQKLGQKAFEFALSEYARQAMDLGEYQKASELRRKYLGTLRYNSYKERLLFYEGMATLAIDKDKGQKLLLQLLTSYPDSSYRYEIERALKHTIL